ncbi:hypothetical protein [Serratia marcescens]|uniref:hypothetical protein n=1 Tax=Serratia marcescens TaxID=615 RepID=UPI0025AAA0DC|nr:hypothetical protein [Serratia marcescens]MDN0028631.1 hypothetical protein [Serratia marcescens]
MTNEKFSKDAYETAVEFNVQQRFAAMLVHTGNFNVNRRGADMVSFIADRKADYQTAHPDMLTAGQTIVNQQHFTDFVCSGIWRSTDSQSGRATKGKMMELQRVLNTEIIIGDIVHAHGAVFKVIKVFSFPGAGTDGKDVAANIAEWVSGRIEPGYFGPGREWNFQGNDRVTQLIEPR